MEEQKRTGNGSGLAELHQKEAHVEPSQQTNPMGQSAYKKEQDWLEEGSSCAGETSGKQCEELVDQGLVERKISSEHV